MFLSVDSKKISFMFYGKRYSGTPNQIVVWLLKTLEITRYNNKIVDDLHSCNNYLDMWTVFTKYYSFKPQCFRTKIIYCGLSAKTLLFDKIYKLFSCKNDEGQDILIGAIRDTAFVAEKLHLINVMLNTAPVMLKFLGSNCKCFRSEMIESVLYCSGISNQTSWLRSTVYK